MKRLSLSSHLIFVCLLLLFSCLIEGCGSVSPGCTADIERGIEVLITDAQTHLPIAKDAVGTIEDGKYKETLLPSALNAEGTLLGLGGAPERAGTYTVHIEKTGYVPWEVKNVRVTKNDCHVNRVTVEARLQPAP